nr:reverse transcriptase domain-containing protein [Tanacetum cinerariifolium]
MATEGNGDPPVPDLRATEELCQPSLNGHGGSISSIAIQTTNFGLKNDMIQQSIKVNGVTDDALRLYLFPHSLIHHATAWFDRLPRNFINTFEQMAKMFPGKYFPPSMVTKLGNEITNFRQRSDESLFEAWECYKISIDRFPNHNMLPVTQIDTFYNGLTLRHRDNINVAAALKAEMVEINKNLMRVLQINQQVKAVTPSYETCGGPHWYNDFLATIGQTQNIYAVGAYQGGNSYQPQGNHNLLSYRSENYLGPPEFNQNQTRNNQNQNIQNQNRNHGIPQGNNRGRNQFFQGASHGQNPPPTYQALACQASGITTRSGTAYRGPTIPTTSSSLPQVVEHETEVTKDTTPPTNNGSTKDVQPSPNQKPSIPYPSRFQDQKLHDKAIYQKEKFFQIYQDLNFNISFADALILMPKFGPTIKNLLTNKDKLYELARTLLNEHCSMVLLKTLPEKLGDPGKFLIPYDFLKMDVCLALADLDASINLMPLSVWNNLSLPELTPTLMTLELADRLISRPIGVAEDVFTEKALIDVYEGELTLRVCKEAITFNLDQTLRYSANYNDMTTNQIDVIDMDCKEYSQEVLGFSDVIASGNPTPYYDPIISTSYPTLTPFRDSDFLLEEVDAFLVLEDDSTSLEFDHSYYYPEGTFFFLKHFLMMIHHYPLLISNTLF